MRAPFDADLAGVFDAIGIGFWEQLRGKRIFLTGGTGFVGKWLLATLLYADRRSELGCRVTVLSRRPAAFRQDAPFLANAQQVSLYQGDVRDFDFPSESHDFVIHAATDVVATADPLDIFDTCVQGTRRVLDFAAQASTTRVILISSGAMYGHQPATVGGVSEDFEGAPKVSELSSAYGEGKRVAEWLGHAYSKVKGLDVRVARCFAFVGPYLPLDKHFALGNFLGAAMKNAPIVIRGDGTAQRTYLYAADMAAWLWAIALRGEPAETYNVGGNEVLSIAELAGRIVKVIGSTSTVTVLGQRTGGMAPDRYVPSIKKAIASLGLNEPFSLDQAIVQTVAWHMGKMPIEKETIA